MPETSRFERGDSPYSRKTRDKLNRNAAAIARSSAANMGGGAPLTGLSGVAFGNLTASPVPADILLLELEDDQEWETHDSWIEKRLQDQE